MRFGTALVTDVVPKTLRDYDGIRLEELATGADNIAIPHGTISTLSMRADPIEGRRRDFFVWMVMKRQKEVFQVYNFELQYQQEQASENRMRFYAVPLGAYFKPRRQLQTREQILRDYAMEVLETYRTVLGSRIISTVARGHRLS
ncbi:hypothetical protein J2P12_08690 [Candidatus Bathyarchaeota archaeon]|nr:hypothetical protein [Candidatus Bathyarchaeota archaeon]